MTQASNISRSVQRYIAQNNSIKHCLQLDLLNLSALSRQICSELAIDQFDAVLKACKRYQLRIQARGAHQEHLRKLISTARIQVRTKIIVATIEKPGSLEKIDLLQREIRKARGDFHVIEGNEVLTLITNRRFMPLLKKSLRLKLLRLSEDLVQVCMIMDPAIENISGVVAYIYGMLHEHGVNMREEMSCWTDVMFIIEEQDLPRAM